MTTITFVTTNIGKFTPAAQALAPYGVTLVQNASLDLPEIQSASIEEIAATAATEAATRLNQPVIVSDAGYDIPALGGFPGPFVKFINHMLSSENVIAMMAGHTDRRIILRECMAYAAPGVAPVTFSSAMVGTIPAAASGPTDGSGTMVDKLFVPEGYTVTMAHIPLEERYALWAKHLTHLHSFGAYIRDQNHPL